MCFKISYLRDFVPDPGSAEILRYVTANMWLQLPSDPEPTGTMDVSVPPRLPAGLCEVTRVEAAGIAQVATIDMAGGRVVWVVGPGVETAQGRCIAVAPELVRRRNVPEDWDCPVAAGRLGTK